MNCKSLMSRLLAALAAGFLCLPSPVFAADEMTAPLLWNRPADRATCLDSASYAWVEYDGGQDCIRYFASDGIDHAPVVVVVLYGDRDRIMNNPPDKIRNNTRRSQEGYARAQAKGMGVPVIVVARPGTYGSSGDHRRRRRPEEFLPLDAAFDAIKARHGIKEFVVLGHSGGATAGAALLTLGRTDIRCAVLTSGAYSLAERDAMRREASGRRPRARAAAWERGLYDPLDHVDGIVPVPERRIYIVGNPADTVTPFVLQEKFAQAVQERGHKVILKEADAAPPAFHNLRGGAGSVIATDCARSE